MVRRSAPARSRRPGRRGDAPSSPGHPAQPKPGPRSRSSRMKGPILWAAFDPAGRRLATASADHTARIWDVEHRRRHHASPAPRRTGQLGRVSGRRYPALECLRRRDDPDLERRRRPTDRGRPARPWIAAAPGPLQSRRPADRLGRIQRDRLPLGRRGWDIRRLCLSGWIRICSAWPSVPTV